MNIEERLKIGHSKAITNEIIGFIGNDKVLFKELVTLVLENNNEIAPWAAWPMSYVVEQYPHLATPWIEKLLIRMTEKKIHPGIKRNILRAFESVEIPEKHEGKAIDVFFAEITNPENPPAIIAFAITAAARICNKYPELKTEFNLLLEPLRQHPQPASITSRLNSVEKAKKIKKKL